MSKILKSIKKNTETNTFLYMKKKYSAPKIYNANGDLSKRWYVYYSFRDPKSDLLVRQPPVYAGVNELKTKAERTEAITILRKSVSVILENGYNPYIKDEFSDDNKTYTIDYCFEFVLNLKKNSLSQVSYKDFSSRVNQFKKWLYDKGFKLKTIDKINKKAINAYLNEVQLKSSSMNRNNTRASLSSFFGTLESNEIILQNPVSKIEILKAKPKRNKSYTIVQEQDIFNYLEKENPVLLLFIKFISYNFLRPVEVCRLKIKDVDILNKKIYLKTKNKQVKIKIIPDILINEIPNLSLLNENNYLFSKKCYGEIWESKETTRRNYYSEEFSIIKEKFKLGTDYGLYSFRHTFITKIYTELVKTRTPNEAKNQLMLITGHNTMSALEKYLRDIDAVFPEDYSHLIKTSN